VSRLNRALADFSGDRYFERRDKSTQYLTVVGYSSVLSQQQATIKIEVSLRNHYLRRDLWLGSNNVAEPAHQIKDVVHADHSALYRKNQAWRKVPRGLSPA